MSLLCITLDHKEKRLGTDHEENATNASVPAGGEDSPLPELPSLCLWGSFSALNTSA